jgi:hypothetical protein
MEKLLTGRGQKWWWRRWFRCREREIDLQCLKSVSKGWQRRRELSEVLSRWRNSACEENGNGERQPAFNEDGSARVTQGRVKHVTHGARVAAVMRWKWTQRCSRWRASGDRGALSGRLGWRGGYGPQQRFPMGWPRKRRTNQSHAK